jgi:hypothetical protein
LSLIFFRDYVEQKNIYKMKKLELKKNSIQVLNSEELNQVNGGIQFLSIWGKKCKDECPDDAGSGDYSTNKGDDCRSATGNLCNCPNGDGVVDLGGGDIDVATINDSNIISFS